MSHPRRPIYMTGSYYHLYNRGVHREPIFREDANYFYLLRNLKTYSQQLRIQPIAYCLMPNHYHFLVRQDDKEPAGLLVQRLFNSYVKAYNERYAHHGTLFEGSYQCILVDNDEYLRHLCRYIHLNPVGAGLAQRPEDWPFSNYQEFIGQRRGTIVDPGFVRMQFTSPERYRAFVEGYAATNSVPRTLADWMKKFELSLQQMD